MVHRTHWTSYPKMMDKSIMVDGLAVLREEVLEFVGSKVCLDGNARHAIAHRSAQANKCMAKWRLVLSSSWLTRLLRLNIVKNYNVAGPSLKFECLDDGQDPKIQNCELECEDGGERHRREEAALDGIRTSGGDYGTELAIDGSKRQYERVDCHQRTYAQLGWSCCQDGPQRNLCEGLEMPRSSMVEMETGSLERSGERQMVWPTPSTVQKSRGGRTWLLVKSPNSLEMQTVCRNLSRTTRVGCILLKTVEAGNSFRNVETALYRWFRVPRGPMCVRHDWDGCRCCLVDKEKKRERKVWHALGTPLSVSSQL